VDSQLLHVVPSNGIFYRFRGICARQSATADPIADWNSMMRRLELIHFPEIRLADEN
jgi:hypothetical protein